MTVSTDRRARCDVAILAVQERELSALLRLAKFARKEHRSNGILHHVTIDSPALPLGSGEISGVIARIDGVGRVDAAISTMQLLLTVEPRWLFVVGVAGGFSSNGVALGDLIVAQRLVDYEIQRVTEGDTEYRPRVYEADATLVAACKTAEGVDWQSRIGIPHSLRSTVHFGTVLSGDKVVASQKAISSLMRVSQDALGVEMEGAGVAAAIARSATDIGFLMIRGVVDLANSRKREDAERWIDHACDTVAALTITTAVYAVKSGSGERGSEDSREA